MNKTVSNVDTWAARGLANDKMIVFLIDLIIVDSVIWAPINWMEMVLDRIIRFGYFDKTNELAANARIHMGYATLETYAADTMVCRDMQWQAQVRLFSHMCQTGNRWFYMK